MATDNEIICWLSNMVGVRSERMSINSRGDVWVDDSFRLGWFDRDGLCLQRENPLERNLKRYGIQIKEGLVEENSEPQYDLRIWFDQDGKTIMISDQRSCMEAEFHKKHKDQPLNTPIG